MKLTTIVGATAIALTFAACSPSSTTTTSIPYGYISKDSANKMIGSYLTSIAPDSAANEPPVKSFIVDADLLRNYLSNDSIKGVKIMLAHTLQYINSGHGGQNAGYKSGALTIVIAAFDLDSNYVFHATSMVADHATPCPRNCPATGTASGNLLE